MRASSASPAIIQIDLVALLPSSSYLNLTHENTYHYFKSRLTMSVNKAHSGMLSETIGVVKTRPINSTQLATWYAETN